MLASIDFTTRGLPATMLPVNMKLWWFKPQFTFPVSMLSCLILLRHHDNIQRLWRRQETIASLPGSFRRSSAR
jgi:glycerol-3-phosphate acyltransferase PlsY